MEQRWIKKPITSDNKFYSLKYNREYNTRIRFRAGFEFPLVDNVTKDLNFIVFNEVFMILESIYPYNFNQNWTFFGFKKRLNSKAVLLSGFQRNSIFRVVTIFIKIYGHQSSSTKYKASFYYKYAI